jgi:hypothetical protein
MSYPDLSCGIGHYAMDREVRVHWARDIPGRRLPVLDTQVLEVPYWPTAVAGAGVDRFVVAGKRRSGETAIELWVFDDSQELPVPRRDSEIEIPIARRSVLYDASRPDKNMVRFMWQNIGLEHHVFVQFHGSFDLYDLDIRSKTLTLVLSPRAGREVEQQPALARSFNNRWLAEHKTYGYVYFLSNAPNTATPGSLVLMDRDKNGHLDIGGSRMIGPEEWEELGFGSGANYVK